MTLPFEQNYVEPFYSSKLQVVWAATNQLPATAKIYKVVPANFSSSAISNLTALGGSANLKRGAMNLYKPTDGRLPLEKVPDKARAYELGIGLLAKLEIPVGELMSEGGKPVAGYSPGTRGHMDKATRKMITEPCTMGVQFRRALDGIECFGQQVRIQFESQEAMTQLDVRWCGVQADKTCVVATPDQIISWIKEGRARAHPIETTGQRWIRVADIKKVTIRQVRLCYDAEPDTENPEKFPNYLYPYLGIEAEIEFSSTDRETLGISCPIIKEALSSANRKTSEFNILPKTFFENEARREGSQ
ncbi:MAG: hypothetical protein EXS35_00470 [Pedosphaera sp.]|nr:hypothetical protein [Pedosphaera sp.]